MDKKLKKALIVVDYQNEFVVGSLGFEKAKLIENKIYEKIKQYVHEECDVLLTLDTHFDETYEKNNMDCNNGWSLYGKVKEFNSAVTKVFSKFTFAPIDLNEYLRDKQYDSIELVGVVTNICVLANAVIAQVSLPDAEIIIDALCVASDDETLHEKALDIMEGFKFKIINKKL